MAEIRDKQLQSRICGCFFMGTLYLMLLNRTFDFHVWSVSDKKNKSVGFPTDSHKEYFQ